MVGLVFDSGNSIAVETIASADYWSSETDSLLYKAAEKALKKHWGVSPFYIREGGTLPSCDYLHKALSAPLIQLPLGQYNDNAHLPNERICLENLIKGKEVIKTCIKQCVWALYQAKHPPVETCL